MIFDGRWKWELKKLSWAISLWKKAPRYGEYGKHQLNRAVLYSATVLRTYVWGVAGYADQKRIRRFLGSIGL